MARLFDDGSSEYLSNANAVVSSRPLALVCFYNCDDGSLDNQGVVCICVEGAGSDHQYNIGWNVTGGSPDGIRASVKGATGWGSAETAVNWTPDTWNHACAIFVTATDHRVFINGGNKVTSSGDSGIVSGLDKTIIGAEERAGGAPQGFISGKVAEVAVYDLSVWPGATDSDKADNFEKIVPSLAKGYSPEMYPLGLVSYWRLLRGLNDRVGGYHMTASGTVVAAHHRIIYSSKLWVPSAVSVQAYTRGDVVTMPSDDSDLETEFSTSDYDDVDADDATRVSQEATGEFAAFLFKDKHTQQEQVSVTWNGQSSRAPSDSTVYLQIYNRNTPAWETLDSNSSAAANTDFDLSGIVSSDLGYYFDANFWIACRVYQEAS